MIVAAKWSAEIDGDTQTPKVPAGQSLLPAKLPAQPVLNGSVRVSLTSDFATILQLAVAKVYPYEMAWPASLSCFMLKIFIV